MFKNKDDEYLKLKYLESRNTCAFFIKNATMTVTIHLPEVVCSYEIIHGKSFTLTMYYSVQLAFKQYINYIDMYADSGENMS